MGATSLLREVGATPNVQDVPGLTISAHLMAHQRRMAALARQVCNHMYRVGLLVQRLWPVWQWAAGVESLRHTITAEPVAHATPETGLLDVYFLASFQVQGK